MWKLYCSLASAIALTFIVTLSFAQYKPLRFKNFGKEDGLSSTDITGIAQTPDGYLWIGTSDGLNRFDGYEFVVFRNDPLNANSLADNNITSLYADKHGSLWIGTRSNGLSRYDSKTESFTNYKSVVYDRKTLSNYYVKDIQEDSEGNLWVATALGLNKYIPEDNAFERYFFEVSISVHKASIDSVAKSVDDVSIVQAVTRLNGETFANEEALDKVLLSDGLSHDELKLAKEKLLKNALLRVNADKIRVVEADDNGNLWFAYEKQGLAMFTPSTKMVKLFSPDQQSGFWNKDIRSLFLDKSELWIGTRDGVLAVFNINDRTLKTIQVVGEANNIESITKDTKGEIWFGNDYGLCKVSADRGSIQRYQNEEGNPYSLVTSSAKVIFEDRDHNLWVGCAQGGLSLTVNSTLFDHYKHDINDPISLSKNHVSAVLEDSEGNVWVGYYTMGIDVLSKRSGQVTRYNHDPMRKDGLGKGTVFALFEDSKGKIWIGTYEGGLQYFDKATGKFHSLTYDEQDETSVSGNDVRAITEDNNGNLWIAIHGHGVNKIDSRTLKARRYFADYDNVYNALANDWVYAIYADRNDNIWVGSVFGVSVLYKGADHFISFSRESSNLSHDHVRTITEDVEGNLWFGTHNGLTRLDPKTKQFTIYNQKNGLPNSTIHSVLSDEWNNVWVSTNNGLARLDYRENRILNFTELDGLQGPEFSANSCHKGKSGAMYFGGTNGLNVFYPGALTTESAEVPVLFTSLTLFNKPVSPGRDILKSSVNEEKEIVFASDQNVFSIGFVGLSYRNAEKIQYAYQLEGFDNDWNYVKNRREVTYTNLDPGEYTFKVLAANSSGSWNKNPKTVRIVVQPAWWQTPFAYAGYLLFIALMLYVYRKTSIAREKLKNDLKIKELEAQKTHELDTLKLKFFTNVSHEFKTPLTLINGPIETLLNKHEPVTETKRIEFYNLIHRNAQRLLRLINQLLDMSAIDAGFMKLKVSKSDVVEFCRNIAKTFSYVADSSGIQYDFVSNVKGEDVYFDHDKVEKILYNLISNALKFTPRGGKVNVRLNLYDEKNPAVPRSIIRNQNVACGYMQMEVEDTGVGISSFNREKIFERFYQADTTHHNKNGTGIGLALTRQLVERHHGSISLVSEEGNGCKFTVWLPVSEWCFQKEEIVPFVSARQETDDVIVNSNSLFTERSEEKALSNDAPQPSLLVVEDNEDVRKLVTLSLNDEYVIYESAGGHEGFQKAVEINPDIIISDIVMDNGDGFELCEKIKNDKRTSHIPFVLLTARSSDQHQVEGLSFGADDYVTKPFNIAILKLRIRNLIQARQRVRDKFYSDYNFDPANLASNSNDKRFVNQLIANIEANLSDANFNPDTLADKLNISRSQLYKKVKGLTGLSVSIFVRNIRLRKAAQILKTNSLTVSEVAYEVGFSDPGYFTKCFREMYSVSPSEFMKHPVDV